MHPNRPLDKQRRSVKIGDITIGGLNPVAIQSMTNTDTADIPATVQQIKELADAGSELVRVTVNNEAAAKAVCTIVEQLDQQGYHTPVVGDFHFNGHKLLTRYPDCASSPAAQGRT